MFSVFLHKHTGAKLHKLSSLIFIPGLVLASFSFYRIVEGTNETAAVWCPPTTTTLGSRQKREQE